ncbi:neuropilin and tolloid-like protein 2 isoform X2 [Liolophura sinensis]
MVELDFRDHFMMESANDCRYDFLEVRDGPYGYSPLIGRYCGRTFPPWIESTGNYMWIRFRSDDILQYSGFRAVYNFKVNPAYVKNDNSTAFSVCRIERSITEADTVISYKDIPSIFTLQTEGRPLDCTWELRVPPHRKMLFDSRNFRVKSQDDCAKNFLEIYDGTTSERSMKKQYCVATVVQRKSETNRVFIRIYGRSVNYMPKFKAILTTFVSGKCSNEYFDCGYNMCIDKDLTCNERPNCKDDSDEETCSALNKENEEDSKPPTHAIILGVIGGLFFTVVAISICATCSAKRNEKKRKKAVKKQQDAGQPENTVEMENLLKQGTLPRNIPNGVLLKCGHTTPTATPPEPASTSDLSTATVEVHCPHHTRPESCTPETPHHLPDMLDYTVESGHYKRFPHMDYSGYLPVPVTEKPPHSPTHAPPSPISSINIPEPEFFKKYYLASSIDKSPYMPPLPANQFLGDPKLVVPQEGRMRYLTLPRLMKPLQGNGQVPGEICASCESGEMPEAPGQPYPSRIAPRKSYINPERLLSTGPPPSGRFQIGRHNHPQSS